MTLIDCGEKQDQFTTFCVGVSILIETLDTIGVVSKDFLKCFRSLINFHQEGGSSNVACTTTYAGPSAFSEIETRSLMDFYATIVDKVDTYICFHSAAQMLMYPLGNTNSTEMVPNADHLHEIAKTAAEALAEKYGTIYKYGNAMTTLYVTSGSSRDHAYGHFKTPLVFTYEMREGKEESIFILPPEDIKPNSEEIFDSLVAMITKSKELGYYQQKN